MKTLTLSKLVLPLALTALALALAPLARAEDPASSQPATNQDEITVDGKGTLYVPGPKVAADELLAKPGMFFLYKPVNKVFLKNEISLQFDPSKSNSAKVKYARKVGSPVIQGGEGVISLGFGIGQNALNLNSSIRRMFPGKPHSRFFKSIGAVVDLDILEDSNTSAEHRKHLLLSGTADFRAGYMLDTDFAINLGIGPKINYDLIDGYGSYGFGINAGFSWGGGNRKIAKHIDPSQAVYLDPSAEDQGGVPDADSPSDTARRPAKAIEVPALPTDSNAYPTPDETVRSLLNDPTLWDGDDELSDDLPENLDNAQEDSE